MLQRAETLEDLTVDPYGKYFVGRTWLSFFAPHGRFSGTIVWGEPTPDDVRAWESCADLRISPICGPHATLFDAHKVERLGPSTFGELARYASKNVDGFRDRITRLAIVHAGS